MENGKRSSLSFPGSMAMEGQTERTQWTLYTWNDMRSERIKPNKQKETRRINLYINKSINVMCK